MMKNPILAVAKKEVLDNIRSKWIILMAVLFTLLMIASSYSGILGTQWRGLEETISSVMSLGQYLIAIVGLMLSYNAINGEVESGQVLGVLALPLKRLELIVGKFLGLSTVLAISLSLGMGVGGLIIGINVGSLDVLLLLGFLFASLLYGMVFVSLGLLLSALLRRRGQSMGLAIFAWFLFVMLWGVILLAFLWNPIMNGATEVPAWYYLIELVNPVSLYSFLIALNVSSYNGGILISALGFPTWYSSPLMVLLMLVWILVCVDVAWWRFNSMDV